MRIFVKTKPNAKKEEIQKIDDNHYEVRIKEPPVGGRANTAVVKALAEYFGISPSRVNIVSGHASKSKIIDVV